MAFLLVGILSAVDVLYGFPPIEWRSPEQNAQQIRQFLASPNTRWWITNGVARWNLNLAILISVFATVIPLAVAAGCLRRPGGAPLVGASAAAAVFAVGAVVRFVGPDYMPRMPRPLQPYELAGLAAAFVIAATLHARARRATHRESSSGSSFTIETP
jgi:hypothetical protein